MKLFSIFSLTVCSLFFICGKANAQSSNADEFTLNLVPISNALESVLKLQPIRFEFNQLKYQHLKFPGGTQYGFSPQAVKALFPAAVSTENKTYLTGKNQFSTVPVDAVQMEKLIPFLVNAIQQQQQEIEALKKIISASKTASVK